MRTDMTDYRRDNHSSDGPSCFWLVEYQVLPLVASTGSADRDVDLHKRTVNVLASEQPTIGEAYTAIPADEQRRVTRVSVRSMHQELLGREFRSGANFVELSTGNIGPLAIAVEHHTSVKASAELLANHIADRIVEHVS